MTDPAALSFGSVVDSYDRSRPGYPAEAVRWLIGDGRRHVVELGAGTGKLTTALVAAGHDVLAVEPDPVMAARLRERVPGAQVVVGRAEAVPTGSRTVDVVVCAQSFHWFDHDIALPEIARVLRPGGHLALVWNVRDGSVPWVRRLIRTMAGGGDVEQSRQEPLAESADFGWMEEARFRHWQRLDREGLLDLTRSRSYVATLDEAARDAVLADVSALYDDYGRGADGMQLPYVAECFRANVVHREPPPPATGDDPGSAPPDHPPEDSGTLLIDFR